MAKHPSVLMVNRFYYPFLGGVEFHIANLSQELRHHGCAITVACRASEGLPEADVYQEIVVKRVARWSDLARLIAQHDIVHVHMPRNLFAFVALVLARMRGKATVFTPHCFYPSNDLLKRTAKQIVDWTFGRLMFKLATQTINLTIQDREDSIARGLDARLSTIVPNSVDTGRLVAVTPIDFRSTYGITGNFLLHVGRFHAVKNVDFLVRAQRRLPTLQLVLIGQDDGELPAIEAEIRRSGLGSVVHVIRNARFSEVCGAYAQASALLLASSYEGLPTVMLEAMFFGCPVVASRVGGVPFVLDDPRLGRTYELLNEDDYIATLEDVISEGTLHRQLRQRCVEERYSWRANANAVLATYHSALTASRS